MRITPGRFLLALLTCALVAGGGVVATPAAKAASTDNNAAQTGKIVGERPTTTTPGVMDGTVLSFAQMGNMIIVGGTFTTVRNPNSTVDIPRSNLFAFNATTGEVSTTFVPNPNGSVYKALPAADGTSVYLGGDFSSITSGGVATPVSRLTRVQLSTGARVAGFSPGTYNGQVRDLELTGNRLWVAGKFTHVQGKAQKGLATLNATTGAYDPYFTAVFAGVHRPELAGSVTNVLRLTTNPANTQLVVMGNFMTVNGQNRQQIAMFDIGGTTSYAMSNWYTTLLESSCSPQFDTYAADVQYAPNGSYFIISTTGGYGGTVSNSTQSGCDVVARFESDSTGLAVRPTWGTYTGGDTTWTVEVTDDVVYVGGHQRWQNNPTGNNAAGQGAVVRTGIAALNPVNGMPYRWNPTRTRGVGVKDMLATSTGLYVGSDTTTFNGSTRNRIAFTALPSAANLPVNKPATLPGDVFTVAPAGTQLTRRGFDGTNVTAAPSDVPNGPGWGTSVGAFMLNGTLYTAYSDGSFTKQTFNGTTYGPVTPVNAADAVVAQTDWHGTDVPAITSLFYFKGRIYFTRADQNKLYSRGFEPESDVVGQLLYTSAGVTGLNYASVRGAFVANGKFYFANSGGALSVADWNGTGVTASTAKPVPTAGTGWASRAMFVYQGDPLPPTGPVANVPPSAAAIGSCTQLDCTFSGSGSKDSDGTISSYAWDFGDGTTGTGVTASHAYTTAGAKQVTLTVTDNAGAKGSTTITVNPTTAPPPPVTSPVTFVDAASTQGNRTNHTVTIPSTVKAGDKLLLFFTANTLTPTYTVPNDWTVLETKSGDGSIGYVLARTATASDANRAVTIVTSVPAGSTSSTAAKDVMTVAAYRGATTITSASVLETADSAKHTTPPITAPNSQQWLVSYWSDKGTATLTWTEPAGVTRRAAPLGTGSGHTSAVLGDSAGPVPAGTQGSLVATADAPGSASFNVSVLLG
jgi:PKD repeat protein